MKKIVIFGIIVAVIIVGGISFLAFSPKKAGEEKTKPTPIATPASIISATPGGRPDIFQANARKMKISSSAFANNQKIPAKFTCDGVNISPPLTISEVPQNAQSLALIVDDPDAPAGTFVHWTVWNIAPTTAEIAEKTAPQGATQGLTDFGQTGYGGPCPPSGTHRYFFKLYALNTFLQLPANSHKGEIEAAMQEHILAQTELIGLYTRQR